MSVFKRIFPEWLETNHVILAVHTAVGFGFLGLATALYLTGDYVEAALRTVVGLAALALGVYIWR